MLAEQAHQRHDAQCDVFLLPPVWPGKHLVSKHRMGPALPAGLAVLHGAYL